MKSSRKKEMQWWVRKQTGLSFASLPLKSLTWTDLILWGQVFGGRQHWTSESKVRKQIQISWDICWRKRWKQAKKKKHFENKSNMWIKMKKSGIYGVATKTCQHSFQNIFLWYPIKNDWSIFIFFIYIYTQIKKKDVYMGFRYVAIVSKKESSEVMWGLILYLTIGILSNFCCTFVHSSLHSFYWLWQFCG